MKNDPPEHALEFLLAFDGREHHFEGGCWVKFEIRRTDATKARPHGLSYSFTLHDPNGRRLLGFDNAHAVKPPGGGYRKKAAANDHWHRTAADTGIPYAFESVEKLLEDFQAAVETALAARGERADITGVKEGRSDG